MTTNYTFHHIQITPKPEQFETFLKFYTEVLGFKVLKRWYGTFNGASKECAMIESCNGVQIEVFANPNPFDDTIGTIRHFSLGCDDVRAAVQSCVDAGYPAVTPAGTPTDELCSYMVLCEEPYYAMDLGFVKGPCGELIEFQKEYYEPKND